ncbi:MAG: AmmeMemoRadiSam system protein B [Elusimicrobia bacterium]|nr:AmmeMemoRadiSam system protein B [Elusimicrobiota bacterium]
MRALLLLACLTAWPSSAADMERPPAVAGRFYTNHAATLIKQVDHFLEIGKPGNISGKVLALLVPHAGIEFSGEAAATAFNAVDPADVETVLMIGTAHYTPVEGAAVFPGAYVTPLGRVEYDRKLGTALLEHDVIRVMPDAHDREHSIEVNVPFLQRRFPKAKLVALVMNAEDLPTAEKVGEALAKAVKGRKVLLVASSDLSHYPPGDVADRVDPTTLHAMGSLDPAFFYATNRFLMARGLPELKCTYCGEGAATAVLAAAKTLGADQMKLLKRYNSGDSLTEHVYRAVVGYAAVAFLKDSGAPARTAYGLSDEDRTLLLKEAREALARKLDGKPALGVELSSRPAFNLPAAVFVTLEGPGGLRGCIGTTEAKSTLLEAVRTFAVEAGFSDSRFAPLEASELAGLKIEVSILSPPKPVASVSDVLPKRDGVVLEQDGRRGLFLPQVWDTLSDKDSFFGELCAQKAGLPRGCASDPKTKLSSFTVETFKD